MKTSADNLFFDLDGTVVDSRMRMYRLFCDLVPEANEMTFDTYWKLKFAGMRHEDILCSVYGYGESRLRDFLSTWMEMIETSAYLAMDVVYPWTHATLRNLKQMFNLCLVTDRQSSRALYEELTELSLDEYFESVFVTEKKQTKEEMISKNCHVSPNEWMIGDTGHDIRTGQKLGLRTCAVLSGFMDRSHLKQYNPDIIVPNIGDFFSVSQGWRCG